MLLRSVLGGRPEVNEATYPWGSLDLWGGGVGKGRGRGKEEGERGGGGGGSVEGEGRRCGGRGG